MPRILPPGPRARFLGLSLIGEIKRDLLAFYDRIHREYGDIVYMRLGPYHDFTVFHPDQIREVLVEKAKYFIRMPRPIQVLRQWNGDGILITEGETWQRHRRILQPAFSPKRIAAYGEAMVQAIADCFQQLPAEGGNLDVESLMYDMTTAAICRTMFGTDLGSERAELRRAVQTLSHVAVREMFAPFTWPDWLPLKEKREKRWAIRLVDQKVRSFIRKRRQNGSTDNDLLDMLLNAVDDQGDGRGLTDEQVRDHSMTIFLAGHDTTAAGLVWACWALASNPKVQQQAASEVNQLLGDRQPTFADVSQLPYTEAVIKETLRHWPPAVAVFAHQAVQDLEIGGYHVPRGAICRVFTYVTHHDSRWYPEPARFVPERWLPDHVASVPPMAYLPFGVGPRACIGKDFAMTEMVFAIAMLLQKFQLRPAEGQTEPGLNPSMSLRPAGGLRVAFSGRGEVAKPNSELLG